MAWTIGRTGSSSSGVLVKSPYNGRLVLLVLSVFVIMVVRSADPPPGGYYSTKYDHIDIDNILNHKRLVTYYGKCMLGRGPCTPQGVEFKRILPEALQTNCLRCTEKMRVVTMRSIRRLRKEYPDVWAELQAQWDPTGQHLRRFEDTYNAMYGRPPTGSGAGSQTRPPLLNALGQRQTSTAAPTTTTRFVRITPPPAPTPPTPPPPPRPTLSNRFGADDDNADSNSSTSRVVRVSSSRTGRPPTAPTPSPPRAATTAATRQTTVYTVFRPNSGLKLSRLAQKLLACYSLLCTLLLGVRCI